ncbi:MAG TPA: KH domain-containing protein, partial [Acidimicrobiales bacterium]|nr:KH domain-containing protein [Acidimicrobiales bacterium]
DDGDDDDGDDGDDDDEYEPGDVNSLDASPYEEGDVNTISGPVAQAPTSGSARGEMPVAVLDYLVRSMADDPDSVVIRTEDRRGSTVLRLHVAPGDMGRVIGRRGRTAQAIRTLVGVAGARDGVQTVVDIADD